MEHGRVVDQFANSELDANSKSCTTISECEREVPARRHRRNKGRNANETNIALWRHSPSLLACGTAQAQQINVKIGVLSDMSSLYADIGGPGSVAAAKLAVADFNATNKDVKVEIVSGDHQNKPDVGSQHRQPVVRRREGRHDRRRAELRRRARGQRDHPRQEQGVHRLRRRGVRPHRREVQRPTPCTGPTTPGCWRTAPARRS